MGIVLRAHHEALDKEVAVKVLLRQIGERPEWVGRFVREARAAARIEDRHVVQVLNVGEDAGEHYIVMQYVPGESLGSRIRREGALGPSEAARIVLDVARGLGAAHRQGVIHRDIKPDNILVDREGHAKVVDFGLARSLEVVSGTLTQSGHILGTPAYMSPEQCLGELVDGRSDLYSLGATFRSLLNIDRPGSL